MSVFPPSPLPSLQTDETIAEYVHAHCWPAGERFCPRCSTPKYYALSGGRYRCANCKYTFQDLSGRWINNGNLPLKTWLQVVDLFVREFTVHELAQEADLSYNAAYKAVSTIRFAIMAHAVDARQLFGPETGLGTYLKGKKLTGIGQKQTRGPVPVFGIMERNGWVFIDLVSGVAAETVFHFNHSFHLAMIRAGNIIYTARYRHYDSLIFCGDDSLPYEYMRKNDGTAKLESGQFWSFAGPRLRKFKGVTPQRFPLYLKELEFRFNNRNADVFDLIFCYLCGLVPEFHINKL